MDTTLPLPSVVMASGRKTDRGIGERVEMLQQETGTVSKRHCKQGMGCDRRYSKVAGGPSGTTANTQPPKY